MILTYNIPMAHTDSLRATLTEPYAFVINSD